MALDTGAREGKRLGLSAEHVYNAGFYGLISGVVGARLWYVATYWSVYQTDLLAIISLNPATLSPTGGVFVGLLAVTWYVRRHALPLRVFLDSTALASAVFAAGLALMNLASGDAFGVPTRLPWAIYLWDDYRHPSQVYDFLVALGILSVLWRLRHSRPFDGFLFLVFVALYALARLLLEPLRGDSLIWTGGVRAAQVVGLCVLVACVWMMRRWASPVPTQEANL